PLLIGENGPADPVPQFYQGGYIKSKNHRFKTLLLQPEHPADQLFMSPVQPVKLSQRHRTAAVQLKIQRIYDISHIHSSPCISAGSGLGRHAHPAALCAGAHVWRRPDLPPQRNIFTGRNRPSSREKIPTKISWLS